MPIIISNDTFKIAFSFILIERAPASLFFFSCFDYFEKYSIFLEIPFKGDIEYFNIIASFQKKTLCIVIHKEGSTLAYLIFTLEHLKTFWNIVNVIAKRVTLTRWYQVDKVWTIKIKARRYFSQTYTWRKIQKYPSSRQSVILITFSIHWKRL